MTRYLSIDTETFSTVPIEAGMARYWEAARVLCIAWGMAGTGEKVQSFTVPPLPSAFCPPSLWPLLCAPDVVVVCWNVSFDWYALKWLHENCGWPFVPFNRTTCSMIRAAIGALPQSLGEAAPILVPDMQKDYLGAALMKKMCKPPDSAPKEVWGPAVKALGRGVAQVEKDKAKASASELWFKEHGHEPTQPHTPEALARLAAYCRQDVICEAHAAASQHMPPIPAYEERLRQLDHTINARGVLVDRPLALAMHGILEPYREAGEAELFDLSNGNIETANQHARIRNFCLAQGIPSERLPNMQAETLEELQAAEDWELFSLKARRVIELRSSMALASLSKVKTALAYPCRDGRLRDMLRFYRATTGRWAGAGFQPQNIPRPSEFVSGKNGKMEWQPLSRADAKRAIALLKAGDLEALTLAFGENHPSVVSACLRGLFIAAPGNLLLGADFAQIEARVLAWAAGQTDLVERFAKGGKIYETMAAKIYNVLVSAILKDSRERQVGKFTVLGCGYQMGAKKFKAQLKKQEGIVIELEFAKQIVDTYRAEHPQIVAWWRQLNDAAVLAVRCPGRKVDAGPVAFHCEAGRWLRMRLPSGRCLYYQMPHLAVGEYDRDEVRFMGVDTYTKKWSEQHAYGGFWAENAVQAMSRDLMAQGMLNAEAAGFPLILTVHDELMSEVPAEKADVRAFENCLTQNQPAWAAGIPLKAEGWKDDRYHK